MFNTEIARPVSMVVYTLMLSGLFVTGAARADPITGPNGGIQTAESTIAPANFSNPFGGCIGSAAPACTIDGDTTGNSGTWVHWAFTPGDTFTYTLNGVWHVNQFLLWNDRGNPDSGIVNFDLVFHDSDGNSSSISDTAVCCTGNSPAQTFDFAVQHNVVRLDLVITSGVEKNQFREIEFAGTSISLPGPIFSGFDLYTVRTGSTFIDLSVPFPGAGIVDWEGVDLEPGTIGNTHTVIARTTGLDPFTFLDTGTVSIEMIGSHLRSITPVDTTPFGLGPGLADLHAVINPGGGFGDLPDTTGLVTSSVGTMDISHSHVNGGVFDIDMSVNPLLIVTTVGGSISDLDGVDVLLVVDGTGLLNPVSSIGGQWSYTPTPTRPLAEDLFPAGDFYPAVDPATGMPVPIDLISGNVFAGQKIDFPTITGDFDGDGVVDSADNCTLVANVDQLDTDGDFIGNICDPDVAVPNDCAVNFLDLNMYKANFFMSGDLDTDNNGDGQTNFLDLNIVKGFFFGPPGPSAIGCN